MREIIDLARFAHFTDLYALFNALKKSMSLNCEDILLSKLIYYGFSE